MTILKDIFAELFSMFAGDVRLTIAILAVVALTASLIDLFGVDPQIGGCMLLFGCLTVVVGAVVLAARRQKAAAT